MLSAQKITLNTVDKHTRIIIIVVVVVFVVVVTHLRVDAAPTMTSQQ
jgi:hypothetical protein